MVANGSLTVKAVIINEGTLKELEQRTWEQLGVTSSVRVLFCPSALCMYTYAIMMTLAWPCCNTPTSLERITPGMRAQCISGNSLSLSSISLPPPTTTTTSNIQLAEAKLIYGGRIPRPPPPSPSPQPLSLWLCAAQTPTFQPKAGPHPLSLNPTVRTRSFHLSIFFAHTKEWNLVLYCSPNDGCEKALSV